MKRFTFLAVLCLVAPLWAQEPRGVEVSRAVDREVERLQFDRGGSLTIEPAYLMPLGSLEKHLEPTLGYAASFDVGITPKISWIFGASYFEMKGLRNNALRFRLIPTWMGVRFKYRIPPVVESWWEVAGAAYIERIRIHGQPSSKQEHLTAGGQVATGINYFLNPWLLTGAQFRLHLVVEEDRVFPMTQFGLMIGIRG